MTKKVIAKECRFATHVPRPHPDAYDLHVVKEVIHYDDGTTAPNLRYIKDFKRPVWVTKPIYRNHKQKKEYEELDKLNYYECTQSDLGKTIAYGLGIPYTNRTYLSELCGYPYVYGSDITASSLIKKTYSRQYPDAFSPFTVCIFDTETDVIEGNERIIIASVVMHDRVYTAATKHYCDGITPFPGLTVQETVIANNKKHLIESSKIKVSSIEFDIVENEMEIIKRCFAKVHQWQPDILGIFNMTFDIEKVLEACKIYSVDPKDIFSDPKLPREYRYFKYKKGQDRKVTASGKENPIPPHMQWHSVITPASYYIVDQMCLFKQIRLGEGEQSGGYSLDNLTKIHLGEGKLKTQSNGEEENSLAWHIFMQKKHRLDYIAYNVFDCIRCLELDDELQDMKLTMNSRVATGCTDFYNFKSQPKAIADELYFDWLEDSGVVIAATGKVPEAFSSDEDDPETLGLDGWIATLKAYNISHEVGLRVISEDSEHRTGMRGLVYDSDKVSAYPSTGEAANISRSTNIRELVKIEGIDEAVFTLQNINLLSGPVNALEYTHIMMDWPHLPEILKEYEASLLGQ